MKLVGNRQKSLENMFFLSINTRHKLINKHYQTGFSLVDTLIALLLFTITVNGLVNYQQAQLSRFNYYRESQQAWHITQQILDCYPAKLPILPNGWQASTQIIASLKQCHLIKAQTTTKRGVQAVLQRWYCQATLN